MNDDLTSSWHRMKGTHTKDLQDLLQFSGEKLHSASRPASFKRTHFFAKILRLKGQWKPTSLSEANVANTARNLGFFDVSTSPRRAFPGMPTRSPMTLLILGGRKNYYNVVRRFKKGYLNLGNGSPYEPTKSWKTERRFCWLRGSYVWFFRSAKYPNSNSFVGLYVCVCVRNYVQDICILYTYILITIKMNNNQTC